MNTLIWAHKALYLIYLLSLCSYNLYAYMSYLANTLLLSISTLQGTFFWYFCIHFFHCWRMLKYLIRMAFVLLNWWFIFLRGRKIPFGVFNFFMTVFPLICHSLHSNDFILYDLIDSFVTMRIHRRGSPWFSVVGLSVPFGDLDTTLNLSSLIKDD